MASSQWPVARGRGNGRPCPLSARLSALAALVPKGAFVCDVGSDHGMLPMYLLQEGICEKAVVSDVNAAPLERAKEAFSQSGLSDRAVFCLCDGIAALLQHKPDVFVIAGMGGETIRRILSEALAAIPSGAAFLLQPMTKEASLRAFLYENGFRIKNETAVC